MSIVSYKKLWEAQLKQWPDSIRLTTGQMLDWAMEGSTGYTRRKLMSVASAIQHRSCVFYLTSEIDGYIGCRFGIDPSYYQSGFGRASLVEGKLVTTSEWG
jgi:hypothetical protein